MGTRIETRFPDSTACTYLGFAALMMAGLDGIIHTGTIISNSKVS